MKKVKLERELIIPEGHYCILWKNQNEGKVCPELTFRKDSRKPKIMWSCNFFNTSLLNNINSIGIKKHCEVDLERSEVFKMDGSKLV